MAFIPAGRLIRKVMVRRRPSTADPETGAWMDSVEEAVRALDPNTQTGADKVITKKDLDDYVPGRNPGSGGGTLGGGDVAPPFNPADILTVPSAPSAFTVDEKQEGFVLSWGGASEIYIAHTQIWYTQDPGGSPSTDIGNAIFHGTTTGRVYGFSTTIDDTYNIWVRFVSHAGIIGDWSAMAGPHQSDAGDPSGVGSFDKLTAADLLVGNGEIGNLKIGNTIESVNFLEGTYGWKLDKLGAANFTSITIKDQNGKILLQSGAFVAADLRNDTLGPNQIAALNANPNFTLPREHEHLYDPARAPGPAPASWYGWNSANDSIEWEDSEIREVVVVPAQSSLKLVNSAFKVNPETRYEIGVLARKDAGTTGDLIINVHETTNDLASNQRLVAPHAVQTGADEALYFATPTGSQVILTATALTDTYAVYTAPYIPTDENIKWASFELESANSTGVTTLFALKVEWAVLRESSTYGATWDVNLADVPYKDVYNNDDSVALGWNPTFSEWTGTYPDGWIAGDNGVPNKETTTVKIGRNSVHYDCSGVNRYMQSTLADFRDTPLPAGTFFAGSYGARLDNYTSGFPGIMVRVYKTYDLTGYIDWKVPVASTTEDVWQRMPWTARYATDNTTGLIYGLRIFIMGSYSGMTGGQYTGDVYFDNLRVAFFDNTIDNTTVTLDNDGTLQGAGGGSVSITGLGYQGDLYATRNGATGLFPDPGFDTADTVRVLSETAESYRMLTAGPDGGPCWRMEAKFLAYNTVHGQHPDATAMFYPARQNDKFFAKAAIRCAQGAGFDWDMTGNSFYVRLNEFDKDLTPVGSYPQFFGFDEAVDGAGVWIDKEGVATVGHTDTRFVRLEMVITNTSSNAEGLMNIDGLNFWEGETYGATWGDGSITGEPQSLADIDADEFNVIASQNSDSFIAGNLIHNGNMTLVAPDGRPLGVKVTWSNANLNTVSYEDSTNQVLKINGGGDTQCGVGWPAFRVSPGARYRVFVRYKSDSGSANGMYVRMQYLTSELPENVTHIGDGLFESGVVDHTSHNDLAGMGNIATNSTWLTKDSYWDPGSTVKWASVNILNASGLGTQSLYIDRLVIYQEEDQRLTDATEIIGDHNKIDTGNISTIIDGAAIGTAQIGNAAITNAKIGSAAVDTLELAGQAVTIPTSEYTAAAKSLRLWPLVDTVQTLTFTSSGNPVFIDFSCTLIESESGGFVAVTLKRGSTILVDMATVSADRFHVPNDETVQFGLNYRDTPPSGSVTYTVEMSEMSTTITCVAKFRSLLALEVKR